MVPRRWTGSALRWRLFLGFIQAVHPTSCPGVLICPSRGELVLPPSTSCLSTVARISPYLAEPFLGPFFGIRKSAAESVGIGSPDCLGLELRETRKG